ncbi:MAG: polysaccharide deacetylase family protein [Candidatus Binatia bacterium]
MWVILLYHSIGKDAPHSVPLPMFEQQMEILVRRFQVIRLRDLPAALASASADANIACVTFDDGYWDNYECALPVLERFGIKATFFIATGFLGKSFRTFAGEYPMMTAAQVRELAALGHEIGAHTVSHPKLTKVSLETARAEVEGSNRFLEELLATEVMSFAYPKGDYNQAVKTLLTALGFRVAVTIQEGLVDGNPDWLALPRVWVGNKLDLKAFEAKISPAMRWYAQLRGRI